ncbi:MAG: hypothetical protein ABIN20_00385 [candidate division WOR-3 bacterium]
MVRFIFILFNLFILSCMTMPFMYETLEPKTEKRMGVSLHYGIENFKFGGIRGDYEKSKSFLRKIELGYGFGTSINNIVNEQSSKDIRLQIDGGIYGKVVSPTDPVRFGLKIHFRPSLFLGLPQRDGIIKDIWAPIGISLLSGFGNPEFLTVGSHIYIQPLGTNIFPLIPPFISLTYHHKKYAIALIATIPVGIEYEGEPLYFPYFGMGLGLHY